MQVQTGNFVPSSTGEPLHALPRKFIEPILFLGDRMIHLGGGLRKSRALLQEVAQTVGMSGYTQQHWFRDLTDQKACELLDVDTAKRGALVLLALLIKSDPNSGEAHRAFFTRCRTRMGADPISVPVGLDKHRQLVESYLHS